MKTAMLAALILSTGTMSNPAEKDITSGNYLLTYSKAYLDKRSLSVEFFEAGRCVGMLEGIRAGFEYVPTQVLFAQPGY
jgi:hypothetical protein